MVLNSQSCNMSGLASWGTGPAVLLDTQTRALLQDIELLWPTLLDFSAVERKVERDQHVPAELGHDPSVHAHEFRRMF